MIGPQNTSVKSTLGPLLNGVVNYEYWAPAPSMATVLEMSGLSVIPQAVAMIGGSWAAPPNRSASRRTDHRCVRPTSRDSSPPPPRHLAPSHQGELNDPIEIAKWECLSHTSLGSLDTFPMS